MRSLTVKYIKMLFYNRTGLDIGKEEYLMETDYKTALRLWEIDLPDVQVHLTELL